MIDHCYHITVKNEPLLDGVVFKSTNDGIELGKQEVVCNQLNECLANEQPDYIEPWSFADSILFSFTLITTIGYGNIAPQTFGGRLFCIIYGFIGMQAILFIYQL